MPLASPAAAALLTQNPAESEALLASSSSYRNTHNRGPSMSVAPLAAPTQAEAMQRFIDTEDLTCLEKPLVFETNRQQFKKLLCLQGALVSVLGFGMSVPFVPVASCCPYTYADEFSLRLDKDAITFQAAANDCCCHIAKTLKTLPLEKVQDVELQSSCLLTCFGLKSVRIQTAGQGGTIAPEVSAAFLQSPDKVREAIRLAVKLYRQQGSQAGPNSPAPSGAFQAAWGSSGAGAGAAARGSSLLQRLQDLEQLVTRGVLTREEADGLKVCALAASEDTWLSRIGEAADLRDRGLITPAEFEALKASLVAQLRAATA